MFEQYPNLLSGGADSLFWNKKSEEVSIYIYFRRISYSVCLGFRELHCAPPSEYRTMLCTIDLRCAPPTCVMHHGCTPPTCVVHHGAHFGGAQCTFVLIRWCTRQFWMYMLSHHLDGTQCDVVSILVAVCVCVKSIMPYRLHNFALVIIMRSGLVFHYNIYKSHDRQFPSEEREGEGVERHIWLKHAGYRPCSVSNQSTHSRRPAYHRD